jgi:RNA polymerase sigma-70 factor (ECF subfamily)
MSYCIGEGAEDAVGACEDNADVERVLAGEIDAFAGIVRRWQGPLVNLAYRFCGDHGRAEEMAQEAFLRAYRRLAQWRRDAAFSTWLFALAFNVYRTELRTMPAATSALEETAGLHDFHTDARTVQSRLEVEERKRIVRRAVLSLPQKYKEALLLYYFQQKDVASVAQVLSVPEGTIKARLARGRDLLRRKLQTYAERGGAQGKEEQCAKESM